jgi:hypothetical protein
MLISYFSSEKKRLFTLMKKGLRVALLFIALAVIGVTLQAKAPAAAGCYVFSNHSPVNVELDYQYPMPVGEGTVLQDKLPPGTSTPQRCFNAGTGATVYLMTGGVRFENINAPFKIGDLPGAIAPGTYVLERASGPTPIHTLPPQRQGCAQSVFYRGADRCITDYIKPPDSEWRISLWKDPQIEQLHSDDTYNAAQYGQLPNNSDWIKPIVYNSNGVFQFSWDSEGWWRVGDCEVEKETLFLVRDNTNVQIYGSPIFFQGAMATATIGREDTDCANLRLGFAFYDANDRYLGAIWAPWNINHRLLTQGSDPQTPAAVGDWLAEGRASYAFLNNATKVVRFGEAP